MALLSDIKNCYVGTRSITKIMAGEFQVWPKEPAVPIEVIGTWPLNKVATNYSGPADDFNYGNGNFSNDGGKWTSGSLPANSRPDNKSSTGSAITKTMFNETLEAWTIEQWFQWNSELLGSDAYGRQTTYILGHMSSAVPSSASGLSAQRVNPPANVLGKPCFNFWNNTRGNWQMLDGDGIYKISNFAIGTKVHIAITCPGPLEKQTIWINGKNCGYVTTDGTQLARIESIDCYVYHDQDPPGLIEDMSLMSDLRVSKGALYTKEFDVPDQPFWMEFSNIKVVTRSVPGTRREYYVASFTVSFINDVDESVPHPVDLTDQEVYDLLDIERGNIEADEWNTVPFSQCDFYHDFPNCVVSFTIGMKDLSSNIDQKDDFRMKLKESVRWIVVKT